MALPAVPASPTHPQPQQQQPGHDGRPTGLPCAPIAVLAGQPAQQALSYVWNGAASESEPLLQCTGSNG